jgi:hypothetical protein
VAWRPDFPFRRPFLWVELELPPPEESLAMEEAACSQKPLVDSAEAEAAVRDAFVLVQQGPSLAYSLGARRLPANVAACALPDEVLLDEALLDEVLLDEALREYALSKVEEEVHLQCDDWRRVDDRMESNSAAA